MVAVTRERELKYQAPAGKSVPDLSTLSDLHGVRDVRTRGTVKLDAVYYDTEDGRLAAEGITLRRREGGSDAGWHLKFPVAAGVRDELREPPREKLPRSLAGLVRSRVRERELLPVMRLRSRRKATLLLDAEGEPLAEIAVDKVDAQRLPDGGRTSWSEVEVELSETADEVLLAAVGERLLDAGLLAAGTGSKLERALAETSPPGEPTPRRKKRSAKSEGGAAAAVLPYVRRQVRALVELDTAVRRDLPDSVHRMRVATRRLRSCFRSYHEVLDPGVTRPLGEELRWLAAELGVDRDREVLTGRLRQRVDGLPDELRRGPLVGRLRRYDRSQRSGSRRRLLDVLDSERHLRLLERLSELAAEPPLSAAASGKPKRVLGKAVAKDFDRLATRIEEVLATESGPERDELAHRARKAAKRARYAAEAARPVFGKRARRLARRMTDIQDVLGLHQDTVVTRAALRELASDADDAGEPSFSYGVLHEREAVAAHESEERLPRLWSEVREKGTL